jgi:hypothetical protein
MRGDNKWPPEQTRQQMLDEVEDQKKIAEGPAFRPKKQTKVGNVFFFREIEKRNRKQFA